MRGEYKWCDMTILDLIFGPKTPERHLPEGVYFILCAEYKMRGEYKWCLREKL